MTEGLMLYIVISILYVSDCLVWVGRSSVLFSQKWFNSWRAIFASEYFGNNDGGVALLNPLLPLASNFLAHFIPFSISPAGVCAFTLRSFPSNSRYSTTATVLTYEEISEVKTEGKYLLLNGERFVKCGSEEQAELFEKFIKKVSCEHIQIREKHICEFFAAQFSKVEALTQLTHLKSILAVLKWNCSGLFIIIYVIIPILVNLYGLNRLVIPAAIIMIVTTLFISAYYWHVHKMFYPAQLLERTSNTLKMILCPPTAIRAVDLMTLKGMSQYHPLLLAGLFLGSDSFLTFARTVITDLKHPLRHEIMDSRAFAIISWHRTNELDACMKFLSKEYSITFYELLAPPSWDGVSSRYCPRCSCQFTTQSGECPDCPGVELLPFSHAQTLERTHE